MKDLPTYENILDARDRIDDEAIRTPLVMSAQLNERIGARVFLKCENLQRMGSFKFRGALNALKALGENAVKNGVVACSSGNHAQGVAEAARIVGAKATIVMPHDAPKIKKSRTLRSGARIIGYDRNTEDREAIAQGISDEEGAHFVHPYEDFHVIAGQGTVGLEVADDLVSQEIVPDMAVICAGGGGLMSGITLALKKHFSGVEIYAAEPENFDDQRRSLEAGKRVAVEGGHNSICDAIVTSMPGELAFAICRDRVAGGVTVSDEETLDAVAFAFNELKMVVEPGGAVALAAVLTGKLDLRGKTIMATLSGGNIDPAMLYRALAANQQISP